MRAYEGLQSSSLDHRLGRPPKKRFVLNVSQELAYLSVVFLQWPRAGVYEIPFLNRNWQARNWYSIFRAVCEPKKCLKIDTLKTKL